MAVNVTQSMAQLAQDPLDSAVLSTLRRHCEEQRDFARWAEALELHLLAAAEAKGDPEARGELHVELADLYRHRLSQRDRALAHYTAAFELDPGQRAALAAARALHTDAGAWARVAALWERDAAALPPGDERTLAFTEAAVVYAQRAHDDVKASGPLQEAVAADSDDLELQHRLATLLLEIADRAADEAMAATHRTLAADVLCKMAGAVSDDYALAYLESALDAVPAHAGALDQLEQVAPRMGRADTLAPRWLAAIRDPRDASLSRRLRLKLASAYLSVGQLDDARICIRPLLAAGDPEAEALRDELDGIAAAGSEANRDAPQAEAEARAEADARARDIDDTIGDDAAWHAEAGRPRATKAPLVDQTIPDGEPLPEDAGVAPLTVADLNALGGDLAMSARTDEAPPATGAAGETGETGETDGDADETAAGELRRLRAELEKRLRFRDRRGAAEAAEALLARGAFDPPAVEALEEHFRLSRDFKRLRDLSLRLGRADALPRDTRSTRLREAVMLSETKLGDQEGAAIALEELLAVEPDDRDAFHKLKRLRTRAQQWDELAALLDRRANAESERPARAEILRELGAVERDHRRQPVSAIAAFAAARAFDPGRDEDDVALSELYVATGRHAEAAATYELRLARARPFESPPLLATLAKLYEDELHDPIKARAALEAWRAIEPHKPEILEALIRVLAQQGDYPALVAALTDRLLVAPAAERAKLHARIAELSLHELGDPARAAAAYTEAIQRAPQDRSLWEAAALAFARAGRPGDLDALLWSLAQATRDRALSSALFEHLALTRAARGELSGAISAREAQFAITQERAVLEQLVILLRSADRASDLSRRLDELARRSTSEEARPLRLERASVLAERLRDPEAGKAELERILTELAPDDTTALRQLIDLCIATSDTPRRASAQERLMKLAPSREGRIELAIELVDLYEHDLDDAKGAIRALTAWSNLAPDNPQPLLRLVPLLSRAGTKRELLGTFDKLAKLAISDEETGEFLLRAARVAIELDEIDGAWSRLVPRVVEANDAAAENLLREIARTSARGEQLAALYVGLAQRANDATVERRRWVDAAHAYEQLVAAYDRALEAMLRALAKDLDSHELLAEAERLAELARAWPRLLQVYDALVRRAATTEARRALLLRHAQLLENRADDKRGAFQRIWLAFQLDPSHDEVYAEAKRLAVATGSRDELLLAHERRAQSKAGAPARIEALLDACAMADRELSDRTRALGYLSRALRAGGEQLALLESVEVGVRGLDEKQPSASGPSLMSELAGVYERLADERAPATTIARWLTRAARLHELTVADHAAAYRALERASALVPNDEALLDELEHMAALAGAYDALTAHLQRIAHAALDSKSSSAALARLGLLCERKLNSPSRAADAYEQLVRLRPQDLDAARRLRACLRDAHRFEELLIAIDRELYMVPPGDPERVALLKQAAEAWEFGLKNRYEARDAWKKVQAAAPDDADVRAALGRLRERPRTDDSLLDGDLVVRPEDLRPSVRPAAYDDAFGEEKGAHAEAAVTDDELHEDTEWSALFAVADAIPATRIDGDVLAPGLASESRQVDGGAQAPIEATGTFDAAAPVAAGRHADEGTVSLESLTGLIEQDSNVVRPRTEPPPLPPTRRDRDE